MEVISFRKIVALSIANHVGDHSEACSFKDFAALEPREEVSWKGREDQGLDAFIRGADGKSARVTYTYITVKGP